MALTAFLALVVAPIVLLATAYVWLRVSDSYALARELELAREAGYPLTLEELNASYPTSPEIEAATERWQAAMEIVGSEAYRQAAVGVPFVDQSEEAKKVEIVLPLTGDDLARSRAFVARYAGVIEEAHAARRAGATARFPIDLEEQPLGDLPHGLGLRAVSNLLRLDLETRLAGGEPGSVEDVLTMIGAAESSANEPLIFSQLVRTSILYDVHDATEALLSRSELDDPEALRLQEALGNPDLEDGWRRALEGERVVTLRTIQGHAIGSPVVERSRWFASPNASAAKSLEIFRTYQEAGENGLLGAFEADDAITMDIDRFFGDVFGSLRESLAILTLPSSSVLLGGALRGEAVLETAKTAVACERYRSATGAWPRTLDDLVPDYLIEIPVDPFDERPLRYRVEADGITLYSVGRNQTDDQGLDDAWDGDLVFQLKNRDPAEQSP